MAPTEQGFLTLCAADVMSRDVKVIPADMPLQTAARILSEARISGAPVVDEAGCCIGVLSATDFVHWAKGCPQGGQDHGRPACFCSEWQVPDLDALPEQEVRWHMTPGPVTANPSTPLRELARIMLEAHIHRVVVTDVLRRPVGIVTSTDLLAALANPDGDVRKIKAATRYERQSWAVPAGVE